MTTLSRWKLACALFAAVAGVATVRAHRSAGRDAPAALADAPREALPLQLRRPIRVAASAIGVSQADLIARIQSATNVRDVMILADKLGAVGDDEAVESLRPMLADARRGVPEALLAAFGQIASQRAVDVLAETLTDDRVSVRGAAIYALGATHSAKAEELLLALADKATDPAQSTTVAALGQLGTDRATGKLIELAKNPDFTVAAAAVSALGAVASPTSRKAVLALIKP